LVGCTTRQLIYTTQSLNQLSIGDTKVKILQFFHPRPQSNTPGMQIRAAQRNSSGKLLEIGEVLLTDGVTATVPYWFMFEDGLLAQWGRPEDWKSAAARYDINFNPSPGVPLQ